MNVHENGKVNKQNNRNEKSFTESKYFHFRLNVKFLLLVVVEWNWKTPRIDEIIPPYSTSRKTITIIICLIISWSSPWIRSMARINRTYIFS